jgi:hypothetical protein
VDDAGLYDDADRLRARQGEAEVRATVDPGVGDPGAPCLVGKVTTTSGPAAPGFFKVEVYDVTGTETEGGAGTLTDASHFILAVNLGSAVPAATTPVICTYVGYRWVFRYA